jgi:hypothetical protein
MNWKFWKKKEKTKDEILKDMRTEEQIRLMNAIKQNAADGKPESDNLIMLKEMSYHASMDAEDEKKETEKSNRRSKLEKTAGTISPFVVMGCAIWNAKRDSNGENVNRTDGGKRVNRMLDNVTTKLTDFKNSFKK